MASVWRKPEGSIEFTDREWEVLTLLRKHGRRSDVAERMNLEVNTVNHHVRNVAEKLRIFAQL